MAASCYHYALAGSITRVEEKTIKPMFRIRSHSWAHCRFFSTIKWRHLFYLFFMHLLLFIYIEISSSRESEWRQKYKQFIIKIKKTWHTCNIYGYDIYNNTYVSSDHVKTGLALSNKPPANCHINLLSGAACWVSAHCLAVSPLFHCFGSPSTLSKRHFQLQITAVFSEKVIKHTVHCTCSAPNSKQNIVSD